MITDNEINKILEYKEIDFAVSAIEKLGYKPSCHIVPSHIDFAYHFLDAIYIDFFIEKYKYNHNHLVIFYKKLDEEVEVIAVDTPYGELLINQLKRYFKMKAFL